MKVCYYPGCTLKTRAKNLEDGAIKAMELLGFEMEELPRWNCCGAVYSLADDNLLSQVAPVRDLIRVKEQGYDKVVVLCSMCYNTLARANKLMATDKEKGDAINAFMEEEPDYHGEVEVLHLLQFLRDHVGWEAVRAKVVKPLGGLKVAPYYGCTLLRPQDVSIETTDHPSLFPQLLEALGAKAVDFPRTADCCGTYQIVGNPQAVTTAVKRIVDDAGGFGAELLAVTCPLCDYNLGRSQAEIKSAQPAFAALPTLYFTQLLALALGVAPDDVRLDLNLASARELLAQRGVIAA